MAADRDRLQRVSEALDGEGPLPDPLDSDEEAFLATASRVRALLRVEQAATPPDVTGAVLARIRGESPSGRRPPRPILQVAAAVFVAAALTAALVVRLGDPSGPVPVLADVGAQVLRAQGQVVAVDATLELVEHGAHPDVPLRRYDGTLRYRAPERLWLHLEDRSSSAVGFPANDIELVVDDGTAWSVGLRGCPVGEQPACLGERHQRLVTGLAPFAPDWVAPLDLVVPAHAFLPGAPVPARTANGGVHIETSVARLQRTIDGLRSAGALRAVHPTDPVRLRLDAETFTIEALTVVAGNSAARHAWAASNGYADEPGRAILELSITDTSLPSEAFPPVPTRTGLDASFEDGSTTSDVQPAWLPQGYARHRAGVQRGAGPATAVTSWTDGRAWIRLDVTAERSADQLLGGLGPIVRRIPVGQGVGYTNPTGSVVSLHTGSLDLAVTGSVPLEVLVRVAASLPVTGATVPVGWPQGEVVESLPTGALGPEGAVIARYDGPDLLVVVPGAGQTSAVLRQRPGTSLGSPHKADVVEVVVRGAVGRYEPRPQVIRWIEDGWVRELRSEGLDLDSLLTLAEALEPA